MRIVVGLAIFGVLGLVGGAGFGNVVAGTLTIGACVYVVARIGRTLGFGNSRRHHGAG